MTEALTDEEVVTQILEGESDLFGLIVERYQDKLTRYGKRFLSHREDIEDIVQDVFLKTYENLRSFNTSQKFSPWIYRIAHNTFINKIKSNSLREWVSLDLDTLVSHPVYEDSQPTAAEIREMREMIEKGFEQIDPRYKEVLILYYLEELSYKEISEIIHVPVSTVGIRIKRAKEALKKIYPDNYQYGEK